MPLPFTFRLQPRTTVVVEASSSKKNQRQESNVASSSSSPKRHKHKNTHECARLGAQWGFSYHPRFSPVQKEDDRLTNQRSYVSDTCSTYTGSSHTASDTTGTNDVYDLPSAFHSLDIRDIRMKSLLSTPVGTSFQEQSRDVSEASKQSKAPNHCTSLKDQPIRDPFTPRRIKTTMSILDQPFQFWQELNVLLLDAYPTWTTYQRKKMIHHLIHFLELKVGMDEYVPTLLLLPTPIVEETWKVLVMETFLYITVIHALQDFHGRPREIVHYSNRGYRLLSQKERTDKIRRTQSLFWLYFREPMPILIVDETEAPEERPHARPYFEPSMADSSSIEPPNSSDRNLSRDVTSSQESQSSDNRWSSHDLPTDEEDSDSLP